MAPTTTTDWRVSVARKRRQILASTPPECMIPQSIVDSIQNAGDVRHIIRDAIMPFEQQITEMPLSVLLQSLSNGQLSAQGVLTAFFHRAVVANQLLHCLSEVNYKAAQIRARELDEYWRRFRKPIGPLHGLPISLMDRFHVEGLDSACGFVSWTDRPATKADEGGMVVMLRRLGAVIFCKTAVPMSMMMGETTSNLIGTTVCPFDVSLSAGGACGGEGALIASRGSPLGVGTDVAGSSRIPSSWNGLWAIKCSEERLPSDGIATILSGLPLRTGAIGLISNELEGLSKVFEYLVNANTAYNTVPISWRPSDFTQRNSLSIALLPYDDNVEPSSDILAAMELVKQSLIACGHEVLDWQPPAHGPAIENLFKIFGSTCIDEARQAIDASGEPPVPQIRSWYDQKEVEASSCTDFWKLCADLNAYKAAYASYLVSASDKTPSGRSIDGIVLPVAPTAAVRPGEFQYYGYSAIANVLDYAAGTIPVQRGIQTDPESRSSPCSCSPQCFLPVQYRSESQYISQVANWCAGYVS